MDAAVVDAAHEAATWLMFATGAIVFPMLQYLTAPYGRQATPHCAACMQYEDGHPPHGHAGELMNDLTATHTHTHISQHSMTRSVLLLP